MSQNPHGSGHHTLRTDSLKYLSGFEGRKVKVFLEVLNSGARHMAGCELMSVEWTEEFTVL